jgi:hypothetical protein
MLFAEWSDVGSFSGSGDAMGLCDQLQARWRTQRKHAVRENKDKRCSPGRTTSPREYHVTEK